MMWLKTIAVSTVLWGISTDAQACKCPDMNPSELLQQADVIYLARAYKPESKEKTKKQLFSILQTIKGERPYTNTWTLERKEDNETNCDIHYKEGDVSLLLIKDEVLDICSGNGEFTYQMRTGLSKILSATENAVSSTPKSMSQSAYIGLLSVVSPYLANTKIQSIEDARLAGKKIQFKEREFTFTQDTNAHIQIAEIISYTNGYSTYVSGRIPLEGVSFYAFLASSKSGTYRVVAQALFEN